MVKIAKAIDFSIWFKKAPTKPVKCQGHFQNVLKGQNTANEIHTNI